MERRTFLKGSVAVMGSMQALSFAQSAKESQLTKGSSPSELNIPADGYEPPSWLRSSRAVNFEGYSPPTYPHMKDFDARRLVENVAEVGADILRFAGIAYWAYYPSKVFRLHPELNGRDLLTEVSRECRKRGMHLFAYSGYGHPHMEIGWVDQHPEYADWVLRGPDGKPYGPYLHPSGLKQRLCITGDTYRQAIRQITRELCEHDIDGIYYDGPGGYRGICFCDSCRTNFKKFSGMDLDRLTEFVRKYGSTGLPHEWAAIPPDTDIEALAAWYDWANQLVTEDLHDFRQTIHGSGKFMLCHNGSTWTGTALLGQYRAADGFMLEASIQTYQRLVTGLMGAAMARPTKKLAQMYLGSYAVNWFGQPAHDTPWTSNNTNREDGDEVLMEGFANLACGNAPIYCTGNRLYYRIGSGSVEPVKEVFKLMERIEPIVRDSIPASYVSIVPTWESLQLWRSKRQTWNMPMSEGFALAMLDEGISFDFNPNTEMSEEWLAKQRVIALCGASGISNVQSKRLAAWVAQGGALLATYDTGLYDDMGQLRGDGGALREVLGVEMKGEPLQTRPDCYYRVQHAHPALGEYGVGAVVQGDFRLAPVEARYGGTVLADCWDLGFDQSRGPAIIANTYGRGRTIYVSGSLEALYTASRIESTRRLMGSIVTYLGGGAPKPFILSAPSGIYGVLWSATNGDFLLWVLANVGFKDAAVGRMRQTFVPVSNVEVRIRVPNGRTVKAIHLLRSSKSVPFKLQGGYAIVTISAVHVAEVVHLEVA